jgi:hypothetical protein
MKNIAPKLRLAAPSGPAKVIGVSLATLAASKAPGDPLAAALAFHEHTKREVLVFEASCGDRFAALHSNGMRTVVIERLDRLAREIMIQEATIADLRKN